MTDARFVATTPSMLVAHPSFPANSVKDLVALAKRDPAKVSYAHPGVGTPHQLAGKMLSKMADVPLNDIPYKGGGPMVTDVVGGQVPLLITGALGVLPFLKAGKLKPLAIGSPKRLPLVPDVPTFIESGYPNFESEVFFSVFVPSKVPDDVVQVLLKAIQQATGNAEVRKKLEEQALVVVGSTPAQLQAHFRKESAKWGEVIRSSGIVLE